MLGPNGARRKVSLVQLTVLLKPIPPHSFSRHASSAREFVSRGRPPNPGQISGGVTSEGDSHDAHPLQFLLHRKTEGLGMTL